MARYKSTKNLKIIVPTLNSFKILNRLVRSLKEQTSKDWTVIFVDGSSEKEHQSWLNNLCKKDRRFKWITQSSKSNGIFGAMNDGIKEIEESSWIIFWGSDDWCHSSDILEKLEQQLDKISSKDCKVDLLINKARFFSKKLKIGRDFKFKLINNNFKKSLFFGEIPAHQAVVFNSDLFKDNLYRDNYKIASDLEFFLRLSEKDINILYSGKTIVNMLEGGKSQTLFLKKMREVLKIYKFYFGIFFIIPLMMRYLKKILNG